MPAKTFCYELNTSVQLFNQITIRKLLICRYLFLCSLKEIKKKVYDNKKDKESGREQDESVKVEISEKTVRKHKNSKYK